MVPGFSWRERRRLRHRRCSARDRGHHPCQQVDLESALYEGGQSETQILNLRAQIRSRPSWSKESLRRIFALRRLGNNARRRPSAVPDVEPQGDAQADIGRREPPLRKKSLPASGRIIGRRAIGGGFARGNAGVLPQVHQNCRQAYSHAVYPEPIAWTSEMI